MKRSTGRVLVAERDPTGRALMDRVLGAAGLAVDAAASVTEVERSLDRGEYALAIVDELAGTGAMLEEVRVVRARWPRLPVLATGTILSARELEEMLRLGVFEALRKPFSPDELRQAVARCLVRGAPEHVEALDFAAAMAAAREALASLALDRAAVVLRRAHALAPLDPDAVGLDALRAELAGDVALADRWYRAALALRDDEGAPPPDPREGLARLAASAELPRVDAIPAGWVAWFAGGDAAREPPAEPYVRVATVGLIDRDDAPIVLRASARRATATSLGPERAEAVAAVLARLRVGAVLADEATRARLALTLAPPGPGPREGAS